MRISKRNPIFILVSILTFALGVLVTPVEQSTGLAVENVLVMKYSPWPTLLSFENQDLQKLDVPSTRMLEGAVKAITVKRDENTVGGFKPALFRSMWNSAGERRYVLVEIAPLVMIPGSTSLRVHVFDTAGHILNMQEFNAGYRTSVTGMRIRDNAILRHPLLIVEAEYCLGGHPSTQYYALAGDSLVLVYLEKDRRPDHNNYQHSHMTIGPPIERTVIEWENRLGSTDDAEVLAALVWFNGNLELRSRDRAYRRLVDLTESENQWIKTAAQSVLESKY